MSVRAAAGWSSGATVARYTCVQSAELVDIDKVGAVKKIFRNQKIIIVLCGMFLLTLSGCVTSEEREEFYEIHETKEST